MKALFARKGETEKKISFLSERRAALSQQRDRAYEEMAALEQQDAQLRRQFKEATGDITRRRVTSQLLQLRKDLERRQQLLTVLNQQVNIVGTHLHNLELVHQGKTARLPDSEEITADAARAEEMLASLEADSELASSAGQSSFSSMSADEQALFEELERESAEKATPAPDPTSDLPTADPTTLRPAAAPAAARPVPRRNEPEAG